MAGSTINTSRLVTILQNDNTINSRDTRRRVVFYRDKGLCSRCGTQCGEGSQHPWWDVHHKVSVAHGGEHRPSNLETLCQGCHKLAHRNTFVASEDLLNLRRWEIPKAMAAVKSVGWSEKGVWMCLADWARTVEEVYLSYERIAKDTGLSPATVKRALQALEDEGWLSYRPHPTKRTNLYTIHVPLATRVNLTRVQGQNDPGQQGQNDPQSRHSTDLDTSNGSGDDFPDPMSQKPGYPSFCRALKAEWDSLFPGHRIPKKQSWALKAIYEEVESLKEMRVLLRVAKERMASEDRFMPGGWTRPENHTIGHVAKNLESLLNDPAVKTGGSNGWTPSRIAFFQAERALERCGYRDGRGLLGKCGFSRDKDSDTPTLQRIADAIDPPAVLRAWIRGRCGETKAFEEFLDAHHAGDDARSGAG